MARATLTERVMSLEEAVKENIAETKRVKELLSKVKLYTGWVLFGLLVPFLKALGIDPANLVNRGQ